MAASKKPVSSKTIVIATGEVIVLTNNSTDDLNKEFNEALRALGDVPTTVVAFDAAPIKPDVAPRTAAFKFADSKAISTNLEPAPEVSTKLIINEEH